MRLVGYSRVSRVGGREGESFISPEQQRESVKAYAASRGHEIVDWCEDLDKPGSTLDRPGFKKALELVEAGKADGIAAAKLDRLTRNLGHLGGLLERAKENGWNLIAVDLGLDLGTPNGRLMAQLLGSIAEWELNRRRESWEEAREFAVKRGVHVASRTPIGYRRDETKRLEPDPVAGPIIREIFRRRGEGTSWRDLARLLNDAGLPTTYGGKNWTTSSVSKLISNPVYLGEARSGTYRNPSAHQALVTAEEFAAARVARSPSPLRDDSQGALLAGILRCAGCRHVMKPDKMTLRDGSRARIYRCRGEHASGKCSARASVMGRVIEPFVVGLFFGALSPGGVLAKSSPASDEIDGLRVRLSQAESDLSSWVADDHIRNLDMAIYHEGLDVRKQRRDAVAADLDSALGAIVNELPTEKDLRAVWSDLSINEQRTLLTSALDAVILRQGKKLSLEERTWFMWRGEIPEGFPRRGHRVELKSFGWPEEVAA